MMIRGISNNHSYSASSVNPAVGEHTSQVDIQPTELLGLVDVFLGWLVVIVGQAGVHTLQVEMDRQVSLLGQQRLTLQHCKRQKKS